VAARACILQAMPQVEAIISVHLDILLIHNDQYSLISVVFVKKYDNCNYCLLDLFLSGKVR